jgi:hypothetical protein
MWGFNEVGVWIIFAVKYGTLNTILQELHYETSLRGVLSDNYDDGNGFIAGPRNGF